MEPEYYCTFCEDYVMSIDVVMACSKCNEYKGLIKITNGKEEDY
jgi:hypothetical protein